MRNGSSTRKPALPVIAERGEPPAATGTHNQIVPVVAVPVAPGETRTQLTQLMDNNGCRSKSRNGSSMAMFNTS
jgi:hypothetical protein